MRGPRLPKKQSLWRCSTPKNCRWLFFGQASSSAAAAIRFTSEWGGGLQTACVKCGVKGRNKLPIVLVADVAAALVRGIQIPGLEGRSYNLIDDPFLTAREYVDELQRRSEMAFRIYYRPIWRFYLTDVFRWLVKMGIRHPGRGRIPSYFDWESRTQKAHFDNSRARTELGWQPASNRQRILDEGIGGSLWTWLAACR